MTSLRPSAVAGMFYPADAESLNRQLDACWADRRPHPDLGVPKAIIAPHAGYIYSGAVAASAYDLLRPARDILRRVVVLGPAHRLAFRGMAISEAEAWASPLGPVALDRAAIAQVIGRVPQVGTLEAAHAQEHCLDVHIPFLQRVLGEFALIPVVIGQVEPAQVAALLDALWGGPETLIVISTDLSHYHDHHACQRIDATTAAAIETLNATALSPDQACGRLPVAGLMLAARARGLSIQALDRRTSGDTAGTKDRVVGYGAWALFEADPGAEIRAAAPLLLSIARAAIAARLGADGAHDAPISPPPLLARPGAAFVTLKLDGRLRGCIGSPQAWRPLAEDVADNAAKAACADPRFSPLTPDEWPRVSLSVSVLTPPTAMTFTDQDDLLAQLRPGIDGLIIEDQGKRALFLPSVWEQLPDKALFLTHLKAKAGLAPTHWSPGFKVQRFQAVEIR